VADIEGGPEEVVLCVAIVRMLNSLLITIINTYSFDSPYKLLLLNLNQHLQLYTASTCQLEKTQLGQLTFTSW